MTESFARETHSAPGELSILGTGWDKFWDKNCAQRTGRPQESRPVSPTHQNFALAIAALISAAVRRGKSVRVTPPLSRTDRAWSLCSRIRIDDGDRQEFQAMGRRPRGRRERQRQRSRQPVRCQRMTVSGLHDDDGVEQTAETAGEGSQKPAV